MKRKLLFGAITMVGIMSMNAQYNYEVGRPDDEANYQYLQWYKPLKEYVDHDAYPNFKLGLALGANDYLNDATVQAVANGYFHEVVTGNAMKMASCVSGDGSMNFTTVKRFVESATEAGLNIYGHTLAWHAQQPNAYLNNLLKDRKPESFESNTTVWTDLLVKDFAQNQTIGWTADKDKFGFSIDFTEDGLHVTTTKKCNQWDVQYLAVTDIPTKANTEYRITFTLKATGTGKMTCKLGDWSKGPNKTINFDTDWKDVSITLKSETNGSFLLLQHGEFVGQLWIKKIRIEEDTPAWIDEDGKITLPQPIPLTDEEKHNVLVDAMSKWIKGIMSATKGKVKAWDVVNEAISGGDKDGDGIYDLQHKGSDNDFYWQDYMGDLEYVRQAVRLSREGYAEAMVDNGGDDGQLMLFINDYNLESDWDNNKKLKSLIQWIKRWESDGVTFIDGIGSQMHISCYMKQSTHESKKRAIENSFRLMAESGKLVRISELDMGMVDANGKDVPTDQMTEEMHLRMAELYEWIVQKYLEIIPVDQQWGICQWCATDSPANSGWRANTPVGLWDRDWYRKHTYAGVAHGLGAEHMASVTDIKEDNNTYNLTGVYDMMGRYRGTTTQNLPAGLYLVNGRKKLVK